MKPSLPRADLIARGLEADVGPPFTRRANGSVMAFAQPVPRNSPRVQSLDRAVMCADCHRCLPFQSLWAVARKAERKNPTSDVSKDAVSPGRQTPRAPTARLRQGRSSKLATTFQAPAEPAASDGLGEPVLPTKQERIDAACNFRPPFL